MIQVSIDDYLDGLLSGTAEPSKKAIMKLTKLLENFGAIMVKSTERMEDFINSLDIRITAVERALGGVAPAARAAPAAAPIAAAPAAAPVAAPVAAASSGSVGAPNLSAAPSTPNLSSAAPDLSSAPAPSGAQGATGGGISSSDLMKAAAGLQKAPEPVPGEPGAPGEASPAFSPFGVSANDIQGVRAGLTKVDQDEHRRERQEAAGETGSMPASMVLNMEVKDALAKRASRTSDDDDEEKDFTPSAAPAAPGRSTKQMKEALQGELRDAFSSLLESDTKEEEE
ncbi:MAG: hypothetical protein GOP50_09390 [Candidatus Heimdallarchaeota archaeon]|nr:hypothetical protein [Candidatus Heimdallarchaeota archaeon]